MEKSIKKEKIFDIMIIFYFIVQPFLDVFTSLQINYSLDFISMSTIIRGIFFLIAIFYLFKKNEKKFLALFLIYFFLAISYQIFYTNNTVYTEVANIIQIFNLPILIYFFSLYDNEKINDKLCVILYLIYLNFIIIPKIFNIGFDLSSSYINKKGYFGLFSFGNELSAILIGLLPVVMKYVYNSKSYILKILFYVELLISIFLIGTKTMALGLILVLIYFYVTFLKNKFIFLSKKKKIFYALLPIIIIMILLIIVPITPVYDNLLVTVNYYKVKDISSLFNLETINNVIYSNRFEKVGLINNLFIDSNYQGIMYGLGKTILLNYGTTEIDIFDIFFSIGFFGSIIYFMMLVKAYKKTGLRNIYDFSFFIFILISLFSGHTLVKPAVTTITSLLFILSKNSIKINKKRMLLISNMYPSKKYKYYGSFVKNTEEFLIKKNFEVDKIVITKQDKFIKKLFLYFNLYVGTIIKGIFNNYDYIYVHFISHSSFGAVITKIFSKDTMLILNAHGNDVVCDFEYERKNVIKSKRYIKYADKIVVPSKYFKEVMIKEYSVPESKIYIYPSGGVNTKLFKKIDMKKSKKLSKLNEKYEYIGYISRIEKDKGYDTFIKSIYELKKDNKVGNKKFLIVGTGSLEKEMNDLIKKLDLIDLVEIRSMTSQEQLVNIYNSLEIFVFPTYRKSESLGLVGLEAMACETFVIAANNYGPKDYMRNNKNGFTFKPNDEIDLKNKILAYYDLNNEELKRIRKKERETAIKYDIDNVKEQILEVFK